MGVISVGLVGIASVSDDRAVFDYHLFRFSREQKSLRVLSIAQLNRVAFLRM